MPTALCRQWARPQSWSSAFWVAKGLAAVAGAAARGARSGAWSTTGKPGATGDTLRASRERHGADLGDRVRDVGRWSKILVAPVCAGSSCPCRQVPRRASAAS